MKESTNLDKFIKNRPELLNENVERFIKEMIDLKITDTTRFIVLGTEESILGKYFKYSFQKYFKNNPVTYHRHYSSRGTDKNWVESIWESLNIKADYENTLVKYKKL